MREVLRAAALAVLLSGGCGLAFAAPASSGAPRGTTARPQLDAAQASGYAYREVLGDWDPLRAADAGEPRFIVDPARADGRTVFATVQAAGDKAAMEKGGERIRILVRPGVHEGLVYVPEGSAPITLVGGGASAGDTRIRARLDARTPGARYAAEFGAAFVTSPPQVAAMFASLKDRDEVGTFGSSVAWIRGEGFEARNITFENAHNKDRGDADPKTQSQAVALMVDGADRAHFGNVRFIGFQDTLYLRTAPGGRVARVFVHKSYIEGDMDFIFGDATAYFLQSEIRTLGDRAESFTLAPSTHAAMRFGFVFNQCAFTHDGSANARAGVFKLARQWPQGQRREAVGKAIVLESRIGAHIDRAQPWGPWNAPGSPRYRPVQYDDPITNEPYLAEYRNVHE